MVGSDGVTWMESRGSDITVTWVLPVTVPKEAVMLAVTGATVRAAPLEPGALLMVAVAGVSELQFTVVVRSCVVPLSKVPVEVNCCVTPAGRVGLDGSTSMESSTALVTVRRVWPETPPKAAAMVVEPVEPLAGDAARPLEPAALLIVATPGVDEVQVTAVVRSCLVLSANVPIAANCWLVPRAMLGLSGATSMATRVAAVTVRLEVPDLPPNVAV